LGWYWTSGIKVRYLSGGMDTRIGATSSIQGHGSLLYAREYFFNFLLHTAMMGLPLPTIKVCTQVLNN
jgi:hypothetical protein